MENKNGIKVKRVWFPCFSQLAVVPPDTVSYPYSLWIGFSGPILNLPRMLWMFLAKPLFYGLLSCFMIFMTSIVAGVSGRAAGFQIIE